MKVRDEELLARLRALGSNAQVGASSSASGDDAVSLLGLPERELTPSVRAVLRHLIQEMAVLRQELGAPSRAWPSWSALRTRMLWRRSAIAGRSCAT